MVKVSKARAAALREEIFDATAVELRRVGYDAMALTSVAGRCGLATSAIYNRFPGKDELVAALVEERLEPRLGTALDEVAAAAWTDHPEPAPPEPELQEVLYELELAARHAPGLRPTVGAFLGRRLEAALGARAAAELEGRARPGQDPCAQVLLEGAGEAGSYLVALASEPPTGGLATVEHVVQVALTKTPWNRPAPSGRAARRRKDPGRATPEGHPLDELGEALVLSAADVFAEKGYDAATVADISRRAGVTTGAIYNRFTGKAGLLAEVVLQIIGPRAVADAGAVLAALGARTPAAGGKALAAALERNRAPELARDRELRLEARHAARREPEVAAVMGPLQDHALATLAGAVRAAQADGALRPDVDPEALAWWASSVPMGLWLVEDLLDTAQPIDWAPTFTAVLKALRTRPAGT